MFRIVSRFETSCDRIRIMTSSGKLSKVVILAAFSFLVCIDALCRLRSDKNFLLKPFAIRSMPTTKRKKKREREKGMKIERKM